MTLGEMQRYVRNAFLLLPISLRKASAWHVFFLCWVSLLDLIGLAILLPLLLMLMHPGSDGKWGVSDEYPSLHHLVEEVLPVLPLLVLLFFLVKTYFFFKVQHRQVQLIKTIIGHLALNNARHYIRLPYQKRIDADSSQMAEKVYFQPFQVGQGVFVSLFVMVQELGVLLCILLVLMYFYPFISLALLGVGLLSGVVIRKGFKQHTHHLGEFTTQKRKALFTKLSVSLSAGLDIHQNRLSEQMESEIVHYVKEVAEGELRGHVMKNLPFRMNEMISVVGLVALVYYTRYFEPGLDFIFLGSVFALALFRSIPAINRVQLNMVQFRLYIHHVRSLMPYEASQQWNVVSDKHEVPRLLKEMVLNNIQIRYRDKSEVVLDIPRMEIQQGEITAFFGPSGSGKSSLLRILAGQMAPHSGEIRIDGIPITTHNLHDWQEQLTYINQKPYILQEHIAANVIFGSGKPIDELLIENALIEAGLPTFCGKNMYQKVGEEGFKISEGQKQRLMLARAIFKDSPLVLLDEITANLDEDNVSLVFNTLQKLKKQNKTIIIVSHNTQLLQIADKVYYFRNRKIYDQPHGQNDQP
jgi:ATP-binding cassette, subfamily B, bacterial PglK